MTTQDVAHKLVGFCRDGNTAQARAELYAQDIVSIEGGVTVNGLEAVKKKSEDWQSKIQAFHGSSVSEPVLAENHFAVNMVYDITYVGGYRNVMNEIAVYEVADGKIVKESFFYSN